MTLRFFPMLRVSLIALPFLCLLILGRAAPLEAQVAGVYDVLGVRVDVTAESAAAAQQEAIARAQQQALVILMERIVPQAERARLPALDNARARDLLRDFRVVQENRSDVRYIATMDVRFNPEKVRSLLRSIPVGFAETQSKPLVVLPLYNGGSGAILWSDSNPWLRAWAARPGPGGLVPLIVPLGDLSDLVAIDAAKTASGDQQAFAAVAANHGAGDVLVTRVRPDNPANPQRLSVQAYRGSGQGQTIELSVGREGSEPVDALYARAAARVDDALQENWKRNNVINFDQRSRLAAAVEVYDLNQWAQVMSRLKRVNLVEATVMQRMTRQEARLMLDYYGAPERLATALGQQDLVLVGAPQIGWKIGRAEDAQRIGQPDWRPAMPAVQPFGAPSGQAAPQQPETGQPPADGAAPQFAPAPQPAQ